MRDHQQNLLRQRIFWSLFLSVYRLILPFGLILTFPLWVKKMYRRGERDTRIMQRFGCYAADPEWTHQGRLHVHAVSVGETMIAMKLIRAWHAVKPQQQFVLAVTTATAYQLAVNQKNSHVEVIYAPADIYFIVRAYLHRYAPIQILLIEAEAWPELLRQSNKKGIKVCLVNARLSSKSERRYRLFGNWLKPLWRGLTWVAVQDEVDIDRFISIGMAHQQLHVTGSIKFDMPQEGETQVPDDMRQLLNDLKQDRRVLLWASTHAGEEKWLADAMDREKWFVLCVPRHVERCDEVRRDLAACGWKWFERSVQTDYAKRFDALLVDRTGELPHWTALADAVFVGKSIVASGGQNPCEAIHESKPVMFGPKMGNFEPLTSELVLAGGAIRIETSAQLGEFLQKLNDQPDLGKKMAFQAHQVLTKHRGATQRTIDLIARG